MKKLFSFILALVLLTLLSFGYGFMYTQVSNGVARTMQALERSETLSERDALVRSQQIFLEDAGDDLAALNTYVARDVDVVAIIETVEDTARSEGVTVAISAVNTTNEGWTYHEGISVSFSASGTFSEMMRFISALEALPRASELKNATLEVSTSAWFGSFSVVFVKTK